MAGYCKNDDEMQKQIADLFSGRSGLTVAQLADLLRAQGLSFRAHSGTSVIMRPKYLDFAGMKRELGEISRLVQAVRQQQPIYDWASITKTQSAAKKFVLRSGVYFSQGMDSCDQMVSVELGGQRLRTRSLITRGGFPANCTLGYRADDQFAWLGRKYSNQAKYFEGEITPLNETEFVLKTPLSESLFRLVQPQK